MRSPSTDAEEGLPRGANGSEEAFKVDELAMELEAEDEAARSALCARMDGFMGGDLALLVTDPRSQGAVEASKLDKAWRFGPVEPIRLGEVLLIGSPDRGEFWDDITV